MAHILEHSLNTTFPCPTPNKKLHSAPLSDKMTGVGFNLT